jgi:rubrerythrin
MPDWKNLKDKAMAAVNNAAATDDRQITVTKLRAQANQARTDVDHEFKQFGQTLYRKLQSSPTISRTDPGVKDAWDRLAARQADLDRAQQALQSALDTSDGGNAALRCSSCGATIAASTKFCPECGHSV